LLFAHNVQVILSRFRSRTSGMYVVRVQSQQLPASASLHNPAKGFLSLVHSHELGGNKTFTHIAGSGGAGRPAAAGPADAASGAGGGGGGGLEPAGESASRILLDAIVGSGAGSGGSEGFGQMLHLMTGDSLCLQRRCPVPADTPGFVKMAEVVEFSVELAMRKRKRRDDFEDGEASESESDVEGGSTGMSFGDGPTPSFSAAGGGGGGGGGKRSSRNQQRKKQKARGGGGSESDDAISSMEKAAAAGSGGGDGDGDAGDGGGGEEATGSDTDWSEGFSSDDETKKRSRPPKDVRRVNRQLRDGAKLTPDVD
jgi:hypothetical protein